MDKTSQVEKMADILCQSKDHVCNGGDDCRCVKQAEDLYDNGCRLYMDKNKEVAWALLFECLQWLTEVPSCVATAEIEGNIREAMCLIREEESHDKT